MSDATDGLGPQRPARSGRLERVSKQLARGRVDAATTYVLQVISLGLGFVSQLLVARLAGVSGYGIYAYALAWSSIIVQPSLLGFDRVIVRELAAYQTSAQFGLMRGLLRRSNRVALIAAATLTVIMGAIAIPVSSPAARVGVAIGILTIPLATLGRVRLATLQALRRASLGQLTQSVGRTAFFIIFLGIAVAVSRSMSIQPELAIAVQALAFAAALAAGSFAVRRVLPREVMRSKPQFEGRKWAHSLPMLAVFTFLTIVNGQLPIIMLGAIGTSAETGRFNASWQSVGLIAIGLTSVGQVVAPRVSSLYAAGDRAGIERLLSRAAYAAFALAAPPAIFLTVFGSWFLGLFGKDFRAGGTALIILVIGQLFNAATGTLGVALLMTHYERAAALSVLTSTCINAALCATLIPTLGGDGAAVGATVSMIVVNLLFLYVLMRKVDVRPAVLGIRFPRRL